MTIGTLARATGVRTSRIRYYERLGLLPEPQRRSGARVYDESAAEALRRILVAQRLGFTLAEIRAIDAGAMSMHAIAVEHVRALDGLIARARVTRALLRHAAHAPTPPIARYDALLAKIGA